MKAITHKNIYVHKAVSIKGIPDLQVLKNAKIDIHKNVTLNSLNKGYHINMHSPVKLMADRPGALISVGEGLGFMVHVCMRMSP
jgi:hypothetical protein